MSSDAHLHGHSTSLAQDIDIMGRAKKFIGAVEDEWQLYSDHPADYTIGPPIGFGASSIVYAAVYRPSSAQSSSPGIPCALKVLDLDTLVPRSLQLLQRETTLMSLSKHPNVLRVRGSWMDGHRLYIALRLMNKGSAADVMRYGWPGGMEEDVVRCILRQALSGLNYLHINGFIHRDVKAANLLIDDDGTVLLGDLGVAADLTEDTSHIQSSTLTNKSHSPTSALSQSKSASELRSSSAKRAVAFNEASPDASRPRIGKRKSFVGTPCWMAPELIQGRQYDSSADIWSFGITALELTQGRPPRSRESPQRVLLRIIQEDPPTLDREDGVYKYSRAFKEIVDSCLVKDPSKRPTAEELLQTPFFRAAKKKSYLVGAILKDLPPLTQRQERRVVSRISSANSVESWDFPTTISTSLAGIHKRLFLEDVFTGDDNGSLNISPLTREPSELDVPPSEHANREINDPRSLSSSTSNSSSVPSSTTTPSASSSHTTAPSSYTEPTDPQYGDQKFLSPESRPGPEPPVSIAENTIQHSTPVISEPTLPAPSPRTPTRQFIPPSHTTPIASISQQGLWRKIKNNVKPSSHGDDEGLGGSPRRERGKIGGIFASASMGLLSKQSSRSFVNVLREGR
ncbi:kinase-like protein [Phlegmacium glaucopus]|nr:kinase-like protein [Phlegmacium glaucopus]